MADYHDIYQTQAAAYERMVAAEDVDGNVPAALRGLGVLDGADVLEVGLGTGRLTAMLLREGARVFGVEPAAPMLAIARDKAAALGADPARLVQGSFDALPFGDDTADLAVAGWVFGHQRAWAPDTWRQTVGQGIGEMLRVLRPGGTLALFETQGTGCVAPAHYEELEELLCFLETDLGFTRTVFSTDYKFDSVDEAVAAMGFFFGEDLCQRIRTHEWSRVPEWTGLWTRSQAR